MKYIVFCSDSERLQSILQKVDKNQTFILQNNLQSALSCFKDNTFEQIILHVSNVEEIDQNLSHTIYSILKPDGSAILTHDSQADAIQALKERLTIGGFKHENSEEQNTVIVKKPSWAGKGVASLKKKTNDKTTENKIEVENSNDVTKKSNPFAKVTINNGSSELIDEDKLLSNESEYKKIEKPEDCSTKPKACKNCTCGRAEKEVNLTNLAENIEKGKVTSSCGNCYLGDAFRCSTCPYRGLPAFKPGDKIKLDLSNDSVGGVLNEGNKVLVTDGKVKLQI